MALGIRFRPQPNRLALTANGRTYPISAAPTVFVALPDCLAIHGDQAQRLRWEGGTADRPSNVPGAANYMPVHPQEIYDTTIGGMVYAVAGSFPTTWIDGNGNPA